MSKINWDELRQKLSGELRADTLTRALYATDASVYRMLPLAVSYPKTVGDIQAIVKFAGAHKLGLIPRTAGTSLAGQCVGDGLVIDLSKHFTKILHLDQEKKQVTVEPGVIRDELNQYLYPFGLFFGPDTSTSNRCMIGGMVGNNSSGTTSIQYGVTRDKVVALDVVLSDSSHVTISDLNINEYRDKTRKDTLEAKIYKSIYKELSDKEIQKNILKEFPKPSIHRRNTGYAVDALLENEVVGLGNGPFNLAKLLCGSEGTLAVSTSITLQLDDLPPPESAMVVTHYKSLDDCLRDVVPLMKHRLYLCEMMDRVILDCTKNNREQQDNRKFIDGEPEALLMLEIKDETPEGLETQLQELLKQIDKEGRSYAHPVLRGPDIKKAILLRKAGLGVLGSMVGDKKAVACIEDTAVALEDLHPFITEFGEIMGHFRQRAVYYAHAGAGELHLRPILNLKKSEDVSLFRSITTDVAALTKKYRGSFSGEHGDGIVRAEFIPKMIGDENYALLQRIKSYFDPNDIFNPGKIVNAFPMDRSLRYEVDRAEPDIDTLLDFSANEGILRAAEQCNGSGDCRKTHLMPGTMCPSYHATKDEKDTTRGRANALREVLTNSEKFNRFDSEELKEVFDNCLSCKACASECPSNVDVANLKAEFQHQYQNANGYNLRNRFFASANKLNLLGSKISFITNALHQNRITGAILKYLYGVSQHRSLPEVRNFDFDKYLKNIRKKGIGNHGQVVLYLDEFTRYLDVEVGKDAIDCLSRLGYDIVLFYGDSGRAQISKGFLKQARHEAQINLENIGSLPSGIPIIGLEPSALLTFRDEYQKLRLDSKKAKALADRSLLFEEFIAGEISKGHLGPGQFENDHKRIYIHTHCHQKALSQSKCTFDTLNLPENYEVTLIASGCCGMAGSFGYEKDHYELSMAIGELKLFPAVRKTDENAVIAANGTSCRHQVWDGTNRKALHPASILRNALL